jgi:hypothetical protein
MSDRDDFSAQTKRFVALRAGYRCSFAECSQLTVGPSDESPSSYTSIGEAAHISGAAPGGPRYVSTLSVEERSSIGNAIWLCVKHARVIDRDSHTFTIAVLQAMKRAHETAIAGEIRGNSPPPRQSDLIAIGPDAVCIGELLGVDSLSWSVRLRHFVDGDMHSLVELIGGFATRSPDDNYILLNELGDGRLLGAPPTLSKAEGGGYDLRCPVQPGFPRIKAQDLPRDFAVSPTTNDLYAVNGRIAEVSGVAALPQKIRSCLSLLPGESPMHARVGARLSEYFSAFRDSAWLGQLLKLEVVRHAAIPYNDSLLKRAYTLLQCVEGVHSVTALADAPTDGWLPLRVDLDVKGIGRWTCDIPILVEPRSLTHVRPEPDSHGRGFGES